ncbi:THUMP domain containing 2 [Chamberlinius hualienensis]
MNNDFFVTCGRGMDYFVIKELHNIARVTSVESGDGKVFFKYEQKILTEFNVEPLTGIKSAERLFLTVFKGRKPFKSTIDKLFNEVQTWSEVSSLWQLSQINEMKLASLTTSSSEEIVIGSTSPTVKRQKLDETAELRYRINFRCTGEAASYRSTPTFANRLSKKVQSELNWKTDLKRPQLEIYVHWNDENLLVGFPLTKFPLSKRSYFKSISLRTTVCWAMGYCADIKPGSIVCDPMCGRGTILIELIKSFDASFVIGVDNSSEQVKCALNNCIHANVCQKVELLKASIDALPLRPESVDAVLCDYPFGLLHGTLDSSKNLLPKALKEMDR